MQLLLQRMQCLTVTSGAFENYWSCELIPNYTMQNLERRCWGSLSELLASIRPVDNASNSGILLTLSLPYAKNVPLDPFTPVKRACYIILICPENFSGY